MLDTPFRKASGSCNDLNIEYHLKLSVKQNIDSDRLNVHETENVLTDDQKWPESKESRLLYHMAARNAP